MLKKFLEEKGFREDLDLNCSEEMLWAANQVYNLGLERRDIKLASAFGGGMGIGDKCGALTGAIMVLGILFVEERAHESDRVKKLTQELFKDYEKEMGHIDCKPLKDEYRTEKDKCRYVILKAAEVLDKIVKKELEK